MASRVGKHSFLFFLRVDRLNGMHAFVYQLSTQQRCDVVRQDVDEANADVNSLYSGAREDGSDV
jgi:hypothetical protein